MDSDWETFKAQLPGDWRELARVMGLIHPSLPQLGAKITDIEQVLRLELPRAGLEISLETTTATAMAARAVLEERGVATTDPSVPVDISAPALHYWERKLAPYLAVLVARMTNAGAAFAASEWAGYVLVVVDGTTVTRPGADGTTARVLYAMRLAEMTIVKTVVTDKHGGESMRAFEPKLGELWIGDRGYSNPPDVAWVVDAHADVLVRLNRGALPLYGAKGKRFDVMRQVQRLAKPEAMAEWPVWVRPEKHDPIPGRLCAVRLPEEEAEKARQRLRREYGSAVSSEMLEAAAWVMVFTTVPRERLSTEKILWAYRLRWQMELEIKRDKSIGGMDKLPNFRDDTIATWLQSKLLIQQVARKIVSPAVAFPPGAALDAALDAVLRGARDVAPPRALHRRRDVARHGPRPPSDPRRTVPHRAA
jgi:hypothetical protein